MSTIMSGNIALPGMLHAGVKAAPSKKKGGPKRGSLEGAPVGASPGELRLWKLQQEKKAAASGGEQPPSSSWKQGSPPPARTDSPLAVSPDDAAASRE